MDHPIPASAPSVTGCPEFDYGPGQPNLYRMMRLKQALCAQHGVEQAFERYRSTFGLPADARLERLPLLRERDHAQAAGIRFIETGRAGEPFVHPAPEVHGEGNHRQVEGFTRSQYVACIGHALLRGRSALVRVEEGMLLDVQQEEAGRLDDELDWDPAVLHAADGQLWILPAVDAHAPFLRIDEAFSLLGAHSDFFGHWMCEYLPKFVAARMSGALPADLPVLVDQSMPSSHREALELLYPGITIIEVPAFRTVVVERLWCAPTLMYMPLHEVRNEKFSWEDVTASPQRFAPVIREMVCRLDQSNGGRPPGGPRKIYLARKAFRHRKLLNAPVIAAAARAQGFEVVYPEDHPFARQASLVRGADRILASEGSAIFLAFFASAGAKLCILSHPLTDVLADYNGILQVHGIELAVLTGPIERADAETPHDSDYSIDADKFVNFLARWQD